MKRDVRILLLADIHIGSIKENIYVYNVITDILDKELLRNKTDAVIILGDYFDKLFKVNEEYTSLAIDIMSYMVDICKRKKIKIRLIYGTESHEMSQYRLFNYHFQNKEVDIKLIEQVQEEELFPNINVLYLPEEYIDDKHSYYSNTIYSGKRYNYIFGHGVIQEGVPAVMASVVSNNKSIEKKVPVFKSKELIDISDVCAFGHYHCHNQYYIGSLFRNSFGEETPKGYGVIEGNNLIFIENEQAYTYNSYEYQSDSNVYKSIDAISNELVRIKNKNKDILNGKKRGKIRLIFNLPDDIDKSFKENIRNLLFNDKHLVYQLKETSDLLSEVQSTIDVEYDFILDKSLPIESKIHRFINKKGGSIKITLEELTDLIHNELII